MMTVHWDANSRSAHPDTLCAATATAMGSAALELPSAVATECAKLARAARWTTPSTRSAAPRAMPAPSHTRRDGGRRRASAPRTASPVRPAAAAAVTLPMNGKASRSTTTAVRPSQNHRSTGCVRAPRIIAPAARIAAATQAPICIGPMPTATATRTFGPVSVRDDSQPPVARSPTTASTVRMPTAPSPAAARFFETSDSSHPKNSTAASTSSRTTHVEPLETSGWSSRASGSSATANTSHRASHSARIASSTWT